jgi:hypothetical protein
VYVYLFVYLSPAFLIFGVLGPWEFSWRAGSYIFCVCDSAVWSAGPVQIYSCTRGADGGAVQIFPLLWFCCSGYGTVELVRGGGLSSSRFLQFAVSSLGGWMSVVGFLCYIIRFSLVDLWYLLAVSYFVSC